MVVIPFAAGAKEHGPYLPLGTDQLVMEHLLDAAVREREVLITPPILHGWFPAFRDYPGTEITDSAVFQAYVSAVAESVIRHGATRLVFLNTGINRATGLPLAIVARDIRANHNIATLVVSWDDLESSETDALLEQKRGGHADEGETSIILHLWPDLVDMERAVTEYRGEPKPQIGYRTGAVWRPDAGQRRERRETAGDHAPELAARSGSVRELVGYPGNGHLAAGIIADRNVASADLPTTPAHASVSRQIHLTGEVEVVDGESHRRTSGSSANVGVGPESRGGGNVDQSADRSAMYPIATD